MWWPSQPENQEFKGVKPRVRRLAVCLRLDTGIPHFHSAALIFARVSADTCLPMPAAARFARVSADTCLPFSAAEIFALCSKQRCPPRHFLRDASKHASDGILPFSASDSLARVSDDIAADVFADTFALCSSVMCCPSLMSPLCSSLLQGTALLHRFHLLSTGSRSQNTIRSPYALDSRWGGCRSARIWL
jgi:hypothetical protein